MVKTTIALNISFKTSLCLVLLGSLIACGDGGEKSMVLDCSGKTIVSDYAVKGASTEKHTDDTIRLSFEGKSVYVSGTASKYLLKSYEVCNSAERISFEESCKKVLTDESQLSYSVNSYTGQYDRSSKTLTMSTAERSYERPNKSESFHMKSQALRDGKYACSAF